MNVDRLYAIAREVRDEMQMTEQVPVLEQLTGGLDEIAANPNNPDAQSRVSNARRGLSEGLSRAKSNQFSPAWRQSLEELGIASLLGLALRDRVENILTMNEITPVTAAEQMREVLAEQNRLAESL